MQIKQATHDATLFLCRTPLQARICLGIIAEAGVEKFDLLYFTQNDSNEDREYFTRLKVKSEHAIYLYVAQKKPDILNHLFLIRRWQRLRQPRIYRHIYFASLDSFLVRFIIKKNPEATLFSFDDGTANVTPTSLYYDLNRYKKANIYGRLLGLPTAEQIKGEIKCHYSIYPDAENLIHNSKVRYLSLFSFPSSVEAGSLSFFIGQPFNEYLNDSQINKLKHWLAEQAIDFYVMHPREKKPLLSGIPILEKKGLLAEDAIFNVSKGSRPRIISAYSTVLFNIGSEHADKIYISLQHNRDEEARLTLIRKTGSQVVDVFAAP